MVPVALERGPAWYSPGDTGGVASRSVAGGSPIALAATLTEDTDGWGLRGGRVGRDWEGNQIITSWLHRKKIGVLRLLSKVVSREVGMCFGAWV